MEDLRTPTSTLEVSMGTKVSQYPIEQYKVSENVIDLMTILTKDPIVTKTCYHDKIGFRFHEIPESMNVGLLTSIHYNFLVAVWEANREGTKIVGGKYVIYVLRCPEKVYSKLIKKMNINGDLRQLVLQVSLEGEIKFQGMDFEVMTSIKPPYMSNKELFDEIKKQVIEFKPFVPHVIASMIDGTRFSSLWSQEGTAIEKSEEDKFARRGMASSAQFNSVDAGRAPLQNQISGTVQDVDFQFEETPKKEVNKKQEKQPDEAVQKANAIINDKEDQSSKFFDPSKSFDFEAK